jgi:hypothetical protein
MGDQISDGGITPRDRRFAEVVAQMVMARVLAALCSPDVAEQIAATWRRVLWRVACRLAGYIVGCAAVLAAVRMGFFDHLAGVALIDQSDISRHAPGVLGSLAAMLWIRDTWPRRVGYVLAGAAASHYAAPALAAVMPGADLSLTGFLVGLFSMATTAKVFETLEALRSSDLVERILKRVGL